MPPKPRKASVGSATAPREVKARPRKPPTKAADGRPSGSGRPRVTVQLEGKMALLANGELTVLDMDNEELARMQFKDKNGKFTGRKPANLPQVLVNLMRKELIDRVHEIRRGAVADANQVLVDILSDTDAKPADRIKAALALIERVEGKVPDKVELSTGEKGFEVTLAKSVKIKRPGASD